MVSICAKIAFSPNCRDVKNEVFEKKIAFLVFFFFFYVGDREAEKKKKKKTKWKKAKKPYKICVF